MVLLYFLILCRLDAFSFGDLIDVFEEDIPEALGMDSPEIIDVVQD